MTYLVSSGMLNLNSINYDIVVWRWSIVQCHRLVIVDDERRVQGIVSLSDLFHFFVIVPYSTLRYVVPYNSARIDIVGSVISRDVFPMLSE